MEEKLPLLAVVGPTASGKTRLSIRLAHLLDGEIISADSMQMYRGMDIGTAKPTREEMEGIPHHLIDILGPEETFSVADYAARVRPLIREGRSLGLDEGALLDMVARAAQEGESET